MPADLVRSLRPVLVVALTLVIASAAMGLRAWQRHGCWRRPESSANSRSWHRSIRSSRCAATWSDAENHEARYRALVAGGVAGPWDKLATIDRLEGAFGAWPGVVGDYGVTASTGVFPAGIERAESHGYREVVASLALTPRHELELAAVIDAAAAGTQPADIASCDIRRGEGSQLGLQVSCSLVWHGFEPLPGHGHDGRRYAGRRRALPGRVPRRDRRCHRNRGHEPTPIALALATLFFTPAERARADRAPEAERGAFSAAISNWGPGRRCRRPRSRHRPPIAGSGDTFGAATATTSSGSTGRHWCSSDRPTSTSGRCAWRRIRGPARWSERRVWRPQPRDATGTLTVSTKVTTGRDAGTGGAGPSSGGRASVGCSDTCSRSPPPPRWSHSPRAPSGLLDRQAHGAASRHGFSPMRAPWSWRTWPRRTSFRAHGDWASRAGCSTCRWPREPEPTRPSRTTTAAARSRAGARSAAGHRASRCSR